MRGALGGPRVLLRRLREVMAEPVSAQERLDKVVVLIAANMVAEVCSVYVLRVDGTLELYATEGLKREAVHETVLKSDEGLVGLVASEANPINLSDAQAHPAFSFRPETGEEIYHSFLGVPVLRAVLHHQHAERVAGAQDRHAEEGVVDFFAGFRPEREGRVGLRLRQVDRVGLAGDQADQALVGFQHGLVDGLAVQTFGGV